MNDSEKARYLITNNWLVTLATADKNGKPHVSPVGYVVDDKLNIYWVSNKNAVHSENIRIRPQIELVIVGRLADGTTDAVYYEAEAFELNDEIDISFAMKLMQAHRQEEKFTIKSINDVTGDAVWRIYKACPLKIYKRTDQTLNGQAITVREQVEP